jgi:capsular exopolysaccharide synthesis family protein
VNPPNPPTFRPDYQLVGPVEDAAGPPASFHPQRLLAFLLKLWWVPALTLVLGLGAAAAIVWWQPPIFVSQGRMWETLKLRLPEGSLFSEDVQNFLGTQTELLQSGTLRQLAMERLRATSNNIPLGKDGEPMLVDVRVAGTSKSSVFRLQASSANAAYTRAYLDALMHVYLEYKRNIRKVVSGDTLASITEQVQRAERDLKAEQDVLTAFQRTNNLAILQEEGTIAGGYLARLKTQLSDLLLENRLLDAVAQDPAPADAAGTNASPDLLVPAMTASLAGRTSADLPAAFQEVALLKLQRDRLSRYLRPKHPKIVKLDTDLERAGKLIEMFHFRSREQLAASRQANQLRIENVETSIREWERKVIESNTRIAEAERLRLNVQRQQSIYERLSLLVQNVGISRNIDQETLAILEPADLPRRSYTREIGLLAGGGFGGLGLGLGLVLLVMIRDDRFTSLSEVNEKLGEIIVGQVPELLYLKSDAHPALMQSDDARHAYAESFRSLRSALLFMAVEAERPRVILVTSAVPHEGKSTVATNLARALALGGARVVLVDADLRKGVLHKLVGLAPAPGLAETLQDPARLEQALQTNSLANLTFLASGKSAGHCGDALMGPALLEVLARLRQQFDYVVIDSSPVFAADDATTLATKVDGVLFVLRSRFSRAGPAREALDLLYQRNARILGLVFNQADASARSNYYYKYADYYNAAKSTETIS